MRSNWLIIVTIVFHFYSALAFKAADELSSIYSNSTDLCENLYRSRPIILSLREWQQTAQAGQLESEILRLADFIHEKSQVDGSPMIYPLTQDALRDLLARDDSASLSHVALGEEGSPVGFVLAYVTRKKIVFVDKLGIIPAFQGFGVARGLLHDLAVNARQLAVSKIKLNVLSNNHKARRFYERLGFVNVTPTRFRENPDATTAIYEADVSVLLNSTRD